MRYRPYDSLWRRWCHSCVESEMLLPHTSFGEDVLGLAGSTVAGWDGHPGLPVGADLCHHSGQCVAVSPAVCPHRRLSVTTAVNRRPVRGAHRDDAPTSAHPRPGPRRTDQCRTQPEPQGPRSPPRRPSRPLVPHRATRDRSRRPAALLNAATRRGGGNRCGETRSARSPDRPSRSRHAAPQWCGRPRAPVVRSRCPATPQCP